MGQSFNKHLINNNVGKNNGGGRLVDDFESDAAAIDHLFAICEGRTTTTVLLSSSKDELDIFLQRYPNAARTLKSCSTEIYEKGCTTTTSEKYALHVACLNNAPIWVIRALIQSWPGALQTPAGKLLPLHEACTAAKSLPTVQLLVEAWPASIQQRTEGFPGYLPLHVALERSEVSLDIIRYLVQQWPAASVQMQSSLWGRSPLEIALASGQSDEIIEYLVQQWPDSVKKCSHDGATPLHDACEYGQSLSSIQFLAQQWPEAIRIKAPRTGLPLMLALRNENTLVETIAFLIEMWPDSVKEKAFDDAVTCLYTALSHDKPNGEIISLLIEKWPDAVQIPDSSGNLPLYWAIMRQAPFTVLQSMVNIFPDALRVPDWLGCLPLHRALCPSSGGNWNARDYCQLIKLIVEYWPESIRTTYDGKLPLHLACRNMGRKLIDVIWYIFRLYPQAVRVQDDQYRLPLHIICERKYIPQKLAQRFVREWPASVQVAGQYSEHVFTKKDADYRDLDKEVEEEYNASWDQDNLEHNEECEVYDCKYNDTVMLRQHDYQNDIKDWDENKNHEDGTAVIDDQYIQGGESWYIYALPLDLACVAREKPSLDLIHLLTNGRPPLHFICKYSHTPWIPTWMNTIEYLASILPDDGM